MKRLLTTTRLVVLATSEASAIVRRDASKMSCEEIKATLRAEGRAILLIPPRFDGPTRYDVFISGPENCEAPQSAGAFVAPQAPASYINAWMVAGRYGASWSDTWPRFGDWSVCRCRIIAARIGTDAGGQYTEWLWMSAM